MHLLILDGSRKTELFYSLIKKAFFIYETKKKNQFCIHIQTMVGKPITHSNPHFTLTPSGWGSAEAGAGDPSGTFRPEIPSVY